MTGVRMGGGCRAASLSAVALLLAACAGPQGGRGTATPSGEAAGAPTTAPTTVPSARRGAYYLDDGPGANPPVDLASIPDAVPQPEPLLPRATRPYSVFGRQYTPMTRIEPFRQRGIASWYGRRYHGQPTSSGERYDMYAMTAAHPTLPIPSYARVRNVANGRSVVVRVNDRGPFLQDRVIDLSYTAAAKLGYVEAGSAEVEVELVTQFDDAATKRASADARRAATIAAATSTPASASTPAAAVTSSPAAPAASPSPPPLALTLVPLQARAEASPPARIDTGVATDAVAGVVTGVATDAATGVPAPAPSAASMAPSPAAPARGFWLQFGAFNSLANARNAMVQLARRLDFLGAAFDIRQEGALYKVQAGPWPRREDAVAAAGRVRARTELRPFPMPR